MPIQNDQVTTTKLNAIHPGAVTNGSSTKLFKSLERNLTSRKSSRFMSVSGDFRRHKERPFPQRMYTFGWIFLIVVHLIVVLYGLLVFNFYLNRKTLNTENNLILQELSGNLGKIGSSLAILILLVMLLIHLFLLFKSLLFSLWRLQLIFQRKPILVRTQQTLLNGLFKESLQGPGSEDFIRLFLLLFMAIRVAKNIANPGIQFFSALMVVLQCFMVSLFPTVCQKHNWSVAIERLVRLFVSVFVLVINFVVLPLVVFLNFRSKYDTLQDVEATYNPVYFPRAARETDMIITKNLLNSICVAVQVASLIVDMSEIKSLLSMRIHDFTQVKAVDAGTKIGVTAAASKEETIKPANSTVNNDVSKAPTRLTEAQVAALEKRKKRYKVGIGALGLLVSLLHIIGISSSASTSSGAGCHFETRPWFVTKHSCIVMEIDCQQRGITGKHEELDSLLKDLNPETIWSLTLGNCPELQMPESIQLLSSMYSLDIYNSTIVEWKDESALTSDFHAVLQFLRIVDTKMNVLPAGLQSTKFPTSLQYIEFCATDLTTLPNDLHTKWPTHILRLFIEKSDFPVIPSVLSKIAIREISLSGNKILQLDDSFFYRRTYSSIHMGANPFKRFPEALLDASFYYLNFADGQVDMLSDEIMNTTYLARGMYGYNTTFCNTNVKKTDSIYPIVCKLDPAETTFRFPLKFYRLPISQRQLAG